MSKRAVSRPLRNDPAVRQLLALMREHNTPGQEEFLAVLREVGRMEQQLSSAVEELAAMRKELAQVRDGPVKRALTKAVHGLERSVAALGKQLEHLKSAIVQGCRQTLDAVKERGVSALSYTARFLHIRPALEAVGRAADKAAADCDRTTADLRQWSATYHEVGRHMKNAGRVLAGLEPSAEASAPGKLARAMEALSGKEKALHEAVKRGTERAAGSLARLEQAAQRQPSIRDTMRELNKKIDREQAERPAPAVEREGREPDGR